METLWLKIKSWTKITVFTIVVLYVAIFIYNNYDQPLRIWWWFGYHIDTSALEVIPVMLLAGAVGTYVVRMAFGAVRQIRQMRSRMAAAKMQKDVAEIKAKADMMQTRPEQGKSE